MKYRIIHYRDDNGAGYYTAEFVKMSLFGLNWWTTYDTVLHDCSWPKQFSSIKAAEKEVVQYLRAQNVTSTVVAQGDATGSTV